MRAYTAWTPGRAGLPLMALVGLVLGGCVTEGGRPTRSFPRQPESVQATIIQAYATPPRDTNANGYADTVNVTVYLFDEKYPVPILLPGVMVFEFRKPDGSAVAQWSMTQEQVASAAKQLPPGPGYDFILSLVAASVSDRLEPQAVDLSVTFAPTWGNAVTSLGGTTLRLGRIGGN